MSTKILLINDMVGYGKVALSAAMPILINKGYELFNLPTVLISNTLNYGKHAALDTTEYMKDTVRVWDELGFGFDAISVGFIASDEQARWLAGFCDKHKEKGSIIFFDPIMGDNGKLYNSVTHEKAESAMALMVKADYIVPNYTEACCLAEIKYQEGGVTEDSLKELIDGLRNKGAKSIIITSVPVRYGDRISKCVSGYDAMNDEYFTIEFEEVPLKVNGAGDTFLAIVISHIMDGRSLKQSAIKATMGVGALIRRNMKYAGDYNGIPIEAALDVL